MRSFLTARLPGYESIGTIPEPNRDIDRYAEDGGVGQEVGLKKPIID